MCVYVCACVSLCAHACVCECSNSGISHSSVPLWARMCGGETYVPFAAWLWNLSSWNGRIMVPSRTSPGPHPGHHCRAARVNKARPACPPPTALSSLDLQLLKKAFK